MDYVITLYWFQVVAEKFLEDALKNGYCLGKVEEKLEIYYEGIEINFSTSIWIKTTP